jgi:hypothetical protein
MVIPKETDNNECGKMETLVHCRPACEMVQLLWKTGWQFLKNSIFDSTGELNSGFCACEAGALLKILNIHFPETQQFQY